MLTIDLKDALLCLLIIAGIILAIYLIIAVYNLIKTLKKTQTVLDDFQIVSHIASVRTKQVDALIEKTSKKIKGGQGILNTIPIIIKAITQIAKLFGKQNEKGSAEKDNI